MDPDAYKLAWQEKQSLALTQGCSEQAAATRASREMAKVLGPQQTLRFARADSKGLIVCGCLTGLFSLFPPDSSVLLGLALILGGIMEKIGVDCFEWRVSKWGYSARFYLLGSQMVVWVAVVAYCVSQMLLPPAGLSQLDGLGPDAESIKKLVTSVTQVVYAAVSVVTCAYQGGLALYYQRRITAQG